MLPRGRPQPQPYHGPSGSGYSMNFNQYPQNYPGNSFGGPSRPQNFNKQKRDRARPRYQYSYYSDESLNSNVSGNTQNSRGGISHSRGVGRGSGVLIPPSRNPRTQAQFNEGRQQQERFNNNAQRTFQKPFVASQANRNETNPVPGVSPRQTSDNRSESRVNRYSHSQGDMIQLSMYFCPKCGESYNSRHTNNRLVGKIPLILHCKHTMCQECAYQDFKNLKVNCAECQTDSLLTQEQTPVCQSDMQDVFPPNFYILGVILYYKASGGNLRNLKNMTFVPTEAKKSHSRPSLPNPSDRCCFATCLKEATMFCPSCEGIYCSDCCTVVHKITKKMMSHEPVLRRKSKFSLVLENCGDHPTMQVEFFCKNCDLTACCYCVLDKHTDHERVPLYHLSDTDMAEFKRQKKEAEKALKEVLTTQKKAARLTDFDTRSVKKEMCHYFADCHAKLECLEKKLCDELEVFKASNRGLDEIQKSLEASAEQLKQLVAFNVDKIGDRKLNLRGALDKLKNIRNIPRFLLNESGQSEPVKFTAITANIDSLEDDFILQKCEDSEYRLVTEKELPDDYVIDIDESDTEIDEAISGIIRANQGADLLRAISKTNDVSMIVPSSANSVTSKKTIQQREPAKKKLDMERVDVQHINSMDSFFVQYKKDQSKLSQLNKDIENYVKMGGAQNVQEPQLNDLYLALYVIESHGKNQKEQKWCRARLTEIKNKESGPVYELFFIDYGKTQLVDGNRIRDIPAFLTQKKQFAIECMLYNPMGVNWNKKAHYSLAKILNGKDVYMMEKSYNQGIYEVELMIASSDGGVTSVTDILVHAHNSVEPINDDSGSLDESVSIRRDGYYPTLRLFPNSKKFTKNQKDRVVIATVVDPQNIFVHMVQHQDAFKNMCHAIKKLFKHNKSSGCIPLEGTYVLAEYKDSVRSNWHRAFIKSVDMNNDKVQVLLVDWGLNVVIPSNNIRTLEESFTKLECQAVLIKLAHIAPYNKQHSWSPYATNFIQSFHKSQEVLKMLVQETDPELEVALFDISGNVDVCLNALMVENNLADSVGPTSLKVHWPQFEVTNPEFSEDDGLMSSLLKKVDEQTDNDSEDEVSEVKKRQIDVVKVEGPDLIWIKFLEFRNREREMFRELQIHYSEEQHTKATWEAGEQCVTEVGHEYARGKILALAGDKYNIYLLDKVMEHVAPLEKIYEYNKYFAKFPQAVTKSRLANIRPAGDTGKWSISSIEALQEIFAKHKRIYASKASEVDSELSERSLPLDIWYGSVIHGGALDPDRMKYVSINNSLVKLGFAYKVQRPLSLKPSASKTEIDESAASVKSSDAATVAATRSLLSALKIEGHSEIELDSSSDSVTEATVSRVEVTIEKIPDNHKDHGDVEALKLSVEGEPKGQAESTVKKVNSRKLFKQVDKKTAKDNKKPTASGEKIDDDNKKTEEITQPKRKTPDQWIEIVEQELGEGEASAVSTNSDLQETPIKTLDKSDNNGPEESPYYKTEIAIDSWLPPFRLTKKDFKARVTCAETGGHLYLHEDIMDDVYYTMEANIKEYFDKNPPEVPAHQWKPGELCTIKYTDGKWYRGKILKARSPEEISVFMIDFGSDHNLSPDVLFREVLYIDIESFATKVKLDKVYPRSGTWLTSDYDHFHDLVTEWCRIVVKGPLDVEVPLVDVHNDQGVYVNQKLLELCPNLSRCSSFPIQGADEEDEEDNVVIESVEDDNVYTNEMIMDNFNQGLDLKIRISENEKSLQEDCAKSMKYKTKPLPEELLEGKQVVMEVGGILNYDKVMLHIPAGGDISEEMYDLITEIQDVVDSLPNLKDIIVGAPCLAPFSEDDIWYRARIIGKNVDPEFVDVMFVDYGNSEVVSTKHLKAIRPDYLNLPQQSWEASVNIAMTEDASVIDVMQLMNSFAGKKKYVKLVRENPFTVDLYEKNEVLCYDALINTGSLKPLQHDGISS